MTTAWQALAAILEVVAWLSAPPASLADAARREALRRQFSPPATVVATNATLPPPTRPSDIAPAEAAVPDASEATAAPVVLTVRRPSPASGADAPTDDEETWRKRVLAIRTAIQRDREAVREAESRLALLKTQAVARDDPAEQAMLRQDVGKTLAELDAMTRRVADGERALAALGDEARRLGIPPGWLRP